MKDFFTLNIGFDSYHLVFPWAIGTILVVLLIIMAIQKTVAIPKARSAESRSTETGRPRFRFFDQGFNARMFFGALSCIVAYALVVNLLGFLISTILFMLAITFVFRPVFTPRTLIGTGLNAVITPLAIWLVFGQLFDITLP